jgi:esterase/lipase superfamily enzyme
MNRFLEIRQMFPALMAFFLVGCADRPHGVLCPYSRCAPPGYGRTVEMLVGTTRRETAAPGVMFSGERAERAGFADIAVSIPPTHRPGAVEWPAELPGNPATDFVATRADILDRDEAIAKFNARIVKTSHRQALVFVHGYNNSFEDAVFRFAQLIYDGDIKALPVLFTWPSRAKLSAYGYDTESANYSRDALENLLQYLAKDKSVNEISIVAHSMGNWVTLEALRQMAIRDKRISPKIKHILLAAPDVDYDVFRRQIQLIGTRPDLFTLFVARDDRALAASRCVHDRTERLGAIDLTKEKYRDELARDHITAVDLTGDATNDPARHDRFASSPVIVRSVGALIETGRAFQTPGPGIGDSVERVATGAFSAVGTAAGTVVSAPFSLIDPATGASLPDRINDLGSHLCVVTDALGDAAKAPLQQ